MENNLITQLFKILMAVCVLVISYYSFFFIKRRVQIFIIQRTIKKMAKKYDGETKKQLEEIANELKKINIKAIKDLKEPE